MLPQALGQPYQLLELCLRDRRRAFADGNRCWHACWVLAGAVPGETAKCHLPSFGS